MTRPKTSARDLPNEHVLERLASLRQAGAYGELRVHLREGRVTHLTVTVTEHPLQLEREGGIKSPTE